MRMLSVTVVLLTAGLVWADLPKIEKPKDPPIPEVTVAQIVKDYAWLVPTRAGKLQDELAWVTKYRRGAKVSFKVAAIDTTGPTPELLGQDGLVRMSISGQGNLENFSKLNVGDEIEVLAFVNVQHHSNDVKTIIRIRLTPDQRLPALVWRKK